MQHINMLISLYFFVTGIHFHAMMPWFLIGSIWDVVVSNNVCQGLYVLYYSSPCWSIQREDHVQMGPVSMN